MFSLEYPYFIIHMIYNFSKVKFSQSEKNKKIIRRKIIFEIKTFKMYF